MRPVSLLVALLALVVSTSHARADEGTCAVLVCDSRTKHPGEYSCDTPPCYCNDTCGGGGSTSSQNNAAMAQGLAKLLGYTFLGVAFVFMPGHIGEAMNKDGKKQTGKEARDAWNDHVAKRNRLVQAGRDAARARRDFEKLDDEERAQLRDAPTRKRIDVPKRFDPPRLRPDPRFQCDQARMLMPTVHTEGPIGTFASETDMLAACGAFFETTRDRDGTCTAEQSYRCGVDTPEACCPRTHPILNLCDGKCYRDTDFRGGGEEYNGRHCASSRDCATFNPTNP